MPVIMHKARGVTTGISSSTKGGGGSPSALFFVKLHEICSGISNVPVVFIRGNGGSFLTYKAEYNNMDDSQSRFS